MKNLLVVSTIFIVFSTSSFASEQKSFIFSTYLTGQSGSYFISSPFLKKGLYSVYCNVKPMFGSWQWVKLSFSPIIPTLLLTPSNTSVIAKIPAQNMMPGYGFSLNYVDSTNDFILKLQCEAIPYYNSCPMCQQQ